MTSFDELSGKQDDVGQCQLQDGHGREVHAEVIPFPRGRNATRTGSSWSGRHPQRPLAPLVRAERSLSAEVAIRLGGVLCRPRPTDRVCAVSIFGFAEWCMIEESFGADLSRQLAALIHERLTKNLRGSDMLLQIDSDANALVLDDLASRDETAA